jgi:hypothetical protein
MNKLSNFGFGFFFLKKPSIELELNLRFRLKLVVIIVLGPFSKPDTHARHRQAIIFPGLDRFFGAQTE